MIETALVELIDRATAECAEQQRADLHGRLRQIRTRVLDPTQLVLVVGESKQGKSALVNAIVNAPVCASGDDVTTVVPTLVRHSDEPSALLIEHEPAQGPAALDRVPVPIEQVSEQLERALAHGRPVTRSEIGIPRAVLQNGLALMDTPGVGSVSTSLTSTTLSVVAEADALLMVSDATQELTTNELAFLKQATALCPNVALVLPKIDRTPHWRKVLEVNRKHLDNAGIAAKIFPVSANIRMRAMQAKNTNLNAESGFPPLLEFLKEMASKHENLTRRLVAHNVTEALTQINDALRTELAAQNPRTAAETLVELETAQRRAEDLRRVSSRWQKALNDGISELFTDIEFDFRERSWAVLHQVNEAFETADPLEVWDEFLDWLSARLTDAIVETFEWMELRQAQLAEHVADEMLAEHGGAIPELERLTRPDPLDEVPGPKLPPGSEYKRFDQFLTGLRGSYGGVLMFGMFTTAVFGLGLINVVSISAGVLLGLKSLGEDKDARLRRRQVEAKSVVQRYVEQVIFHVNKEAKAAIRGVHRGLHTHYTRITEDAQMEISRAIQEIKRSAERSAVDRDQRARDIRQKLEEIAVLQRRAAMLTQNRITAA